MFMRIGYKAQRFLINLRLTRPLVFSVLSFFNRHERKVKSLPSSPLSQKIGLKLEQQGYIKLTIQEFDDLETEKILVKLNEYCKQRLLDFKLELKDRNRPVHGLGFHTEKELFEICPELADLLSHPSLIAAASRYLSEVPMLSGFTLWHTPKGVNTPTSSQLFHLDHESERQIKVFIYLHDMTEDHGPMSLIELEKSNSLIDRYKISHSKRLNFGNIEDELLKQCELMTGKKGDVLIVDTSRLIHMGARNKNRERNIFLCQYLPAAAVQFKHETMLHLPKRKTFKKLQAAIDQR